MIRKRLCVEGEGGSDDRRVLSLLKTFARWVSGPALSEEEKEATYQKMLFTLGTRWAWSGACVYVYVRTYTYTQSGASPTGQCEFSFTKTQLVMDMNRREMERYEEVYR